MIRPTRLSGTLFVLLLSLAALNASAAEDAAIKSNLDVMSELTRQAAADLITGFQADLGYGPAVWLAPRGEGDTYVFLTNTLTDALWSHKIKSFPPGMLPGTDSTGVVPADLDQTLLKLDFQVHQFQLSYPEIYRSYLIGGKQVKRRAEMTLFARLLDPKDNSVVWVGEASRSYKDQFPYDARAEVEESSFEFTKPPVDPPSWGRIIEPVVVGGIIVGLVYLFYSNQSDN